MEAAAAGGKGEDRGRPGGRKGASGWTPLRRTAAGTAYWQASQVPPLRMASIEQAFFSSSV